MEFHKNVLLTGAGFTKNFGGFLGAEMWAQIFNHEAVQASKTLRDVFLHRDDFDFEALYSLVDGPDHLSLRTGLIAAYERLNQIVLDAQYQPNHSVNLNQVHQWLRFFEGKSPAKGFIFTLNQDLFLERLCKGQFVPILPGLPGAAQCLEVAKTQKIIPIELDTSTDFSKGLPMLCDANLIKLHGSSNWRTSDGAVMIIGRDKEGAISRYPILKAYFDLFKSVLSQKGVRLWVIGYGFGDRHINGVIADAAEEFNLRVYVISPNPPSEMAPKMREAGVWHALGGYFAASLADLFPANHSSAKSAILQSMEQILAG